MGSIKEINIKNRTYFFDDMINIKNFDSNLLKIDKKFVQKHWYLLNWLYHYERFWLCKN